METVILVIHLLLAVTLVGVVLLQRSEGGALGIGGGGGGGGGLMTTRGTANLLTRATAIIAACFMGTSIVLAILAGGHGQPRSILDAIPATPLESSAPMPAQSDPSAPAVPLSQ